MSREGLLALLRVNDYCRFVAHNRCLLWLNNILWSHQQIEEKQIGMGDYIRVVVPAPEGQSIAAANRFLRVSEVQARDHLMFGSTPEDQFTSEDEEDLEQEESEETRYGRPDSTSEPEPHATIVHLLDLLPGGCGYRPQRHTEKHSSDLQFGGVWELLTWLDAAVTQPSWLPPGECDWPDVSKGWLANDWWMLQQVDEICFYTDGSVTREGAGAAAVLFVRSSGQWHFGGYLSQPCPIRCAHYAELLALTMTFHWLNNLMMYCSMTQEHNPWVSFAFDATSAGFKAFGFWGGNSYVEETANIRSIWHMLTRRYVFQWSTFHVRSHQGEPGNEMVDMLAKEAASGHYNARSTSTWGDYLLTSRDVDIKWLWALWKPEWKDYWVGTELHLPKGPVTSPDESCTGIVHNETLGTSSIIEDFQCKVASANVLTLLPNSKQGTKLGLQGKARTESIMQMAHDAGLHIVGLQETRMATGNQNEENPSPDYRGLLCVWRTCLEAWAFRDPSLVLPQACTWSRREMLLWQTPLQDPGARRAHAIDSSLGTVLQGHCCLCPCSTFPTWRRCT